MQFFAHHKILIVIAALVLAGLAWWGLTGSSSAPAPLLTTQPTAQIGTASAGSANDQTLVATLLALRAVNLSGAVFSEPAFQSLRDFSTQIVPEPIGRANPFAPLSAPATASSTKGAAIFTPRTTK